jgi:hypothetical protein
MKKAAIEGNKSLPFNKISNSALSKPLSSASLESKSSTKAPPFCVKRIHPV